MLDVLIVGAGPSGLSAAIYLGRARKDFVILDKGIPGGAIINTSSIENYPGFVNIDGVTLATNMLMQLKNLGISVKREQVIKIIKEDDYFIIKTNVSEYQSKRIILALGMKNNKLGLLKEEKYIGRGISFCALCDGNLYKDKDVIVVGGGNSALEESLYLANICKSVTLIHRRDTFRADKVITDNVIENNKINLELNANIMDIIEEDNEFKGVLLDNGKKILGSALFEYIGMQPSTTFLKEDFSVILDDNNFIITDDNMETLVKGMYAIGDCIKKSTRQIATAVGDGAKCANIISKL